MKNRCRYILFILINVVFIQIIYSCHENILTDKPRPSAADNDTSLFKIDTSKIPNDKYGEAVRYGRELMLHTAYYIGPDGINGKYLGNKMNCTNCHQDAGTKPYSFNLEASFRNYPEYRAREGKVLSLAERINNCIMHPHLGKPLPLDSKEMIGIMAYLKWLSDSSKINNDTKGLKNKTITFPDVAASPKRGEALYATHCNRCHGSSGAGQMLPDSSTYVYPPLWGAKAYQPGSSMHRVIKMAQWLVSNMPYDSASYYKSVLTDAEALDVAAFINDDEIHQRPGVKEFQYPNKEEKAIDYDRGPFADTFSEAQHKYGPFKPIISYWKSKGVKPSY